MTDPPDPPTAVGDPAADPTCVSDVPPALPGYVLEELIGTGGFAEVYRGRQLALDRPVAVKVIELTPGRHPQLLARVRTEAVALGRFQHPNIVPVFDYAQVGNSLFLVMELLHGEDLSRRLARSGRLEERTAWLIARQAAAGLAHAAAGGVVHRDVKPGNLFLVPAPAGSGLPPGVPLVKVTDFGIARVRWGLDGDADQLTAPGASLGTPAYMAPEQYGGSAEVDLRADVYALGATVYQALAGQAPFTGDTVWQVLERKRQNAPPPIPGASPETAALLAAMMASRPDDRPADYDELLARIDALPAVAGAVAPAAAPVPRRRTRKRRWPLIAGLAAVAVAVAGGVWAAWPRTPTAAGRYVASEPPMPLFSRAGFDRWTPEAGEWGLAADDEKVTVMEGRGRVRVRLPPFPDYQLTFGLDPHSAAAAEVRVGRAAGPVYTVRVAPAGGAAFGTRDTPDADFRPIGPAVPVGPAAGRPYREVRLERTGGTWAAWFDGKPLGRAADLARPEPAAWLAAEGGAVRLDTAELTPLVPAP